VPGPLYQVGAVAMCPHGGQITAVSTDLRVTASGSPVTLATDQFIVAGCAFVAVTVPQPCVKVQWTTPTTRCLFNGQPAITALSLGICIAANGVPGGPAVVTTTQPRAVAT
jgi:hypothetical protein